MKLYERPVWAIVSFERCDVLMASDENETDKDYVDGNELVVNNINSI